MVGSCVLPTCKRLPHTPVVNQIINLLRYLFATLLSLYNKWMFSPEFYGFQYPLFVTQTHFIVQFFLAFAMRSFWPALYKPKESPSRKDYVGKVVPTAMATGLDIGLSNLSLKTITLTLYSRSTVRKMELGARVVSADYVCAD